MILSNKNQKDIKNHAKSDINNEICGLILLIGFDYVVFPCNNISRDKTNSFILDPEDYLIASESGKIIGSYHSHPDGDKALSDYDKLNSNAHNLTYIVYHNKLDQFFTYIPNSETNKYIGRNFQIGQSDCFSLIEDYYKNEIQYIFQKPLELTQRNNDWQKESENLINKTFQLNNFIEINNKSLVKHDVLAHNLISENADHFSIYIGNGCILHQKRNKYSTIEKLEGIYKKKIFKTFRLKTLL